MKSAVTQKTSDLGSQFIFVSLLDLIFQSFSAVVIINNNNNNNNNNNI